MRLLFAILALGIWAQASACVAQGLLPDPPALVDAAPVAEAFRDALPPKVDLSSHLPAPRSQAPSRTCVSWAVTYAAGSDAFRRNDNEHRLVALSPVFTYALAGGTPNCQRGTSITRTLEILRTIGTLPLEDFAFDANSCAREPNKDELSRAARWRIRGWSRVDAHDLAAVKGQLAHGRPVIFGMSVGPKFDGHRGAGVFSSLDSGPGVTGHAMVLIGYDDSLQAFRLQNSHGKQWGDNGYAWISYSAWQQAASDGHGFVIE